MKLLEGIRVLDLSRLIPGPGLTMHLADMGADVIKVEEQAVGDYLRIGRDKEQFGGSIPLFIWMNRNKRDISVNIKSEEGRNVLYDLAKTCQVVVEGARPGVEEKMKLGYEDFRAANPKIVYCSITGFGQDGPFAQLGTHGGAYDAVTGLAVPVQLKDGSYVQHRPYPHALTHGSWLGAMAVCAALVRAQLHGEGSYLDISCSDATLFALGQEMLPVLNPDKTKGAIPTTGWEDPEENISVKYCYYKTQDNRYMLIQAIEQHFWVHFCEVVGRPDLATRGDWSGSRMDNSVNDLELRAELIKIFATKTQAEWTKIFIEQNIAGAPYYAMPEAENTELFKARKMIEVQQHPVYGPIKAPANAIKRKGDPYQLRRPAPLKGEHTDEVLKEMGYSKDRIATLRSSGAVD